MMEIPSKDYLLYEIRNIVSIQNYLSQLKSLITNKDKVSIEALSNYYKTLYDLFHNNIDETDFNMHLYSKVSVAIDAFGSRLNDANSMDEDVYFLLDRIAEIGALVNDWYKLLQVNIDEYYPSIDVPTENAPAETTGGSGLTILYLSLGLGVIFGFGYLVKRSGAESSGRLSPQWVTGDVLREVRKQHGETQKAFAPRLNTYPQKISVWERGQKGMPPNVKKLIASMYRS